VFGGAVIAQCLAAAHRTVPANFTVHSMHCYFVLAGDNTIPILYHVEHVRSGKSFATRTVQARQRGATIFTTTMSFACEASGGARTVHHALPMPPDIVEPPRDAALTPGPDCEPAPAGSPFESRQRQILNTASPAPYEKRTRQWVRARGRISPAGGHQAHLSALAYMSDSYFIGTVSRIHDLYLPPPLSSASSSSSSSSGGASLPAEETGDGAARSAGRPEVGMMVSLDHSIYFHEPRKVRADEWVFTEMESPWAGDGRGVVMQKMWARDGTLIATCFQEGVVRLTQNAGQEMAAAAEAGKARL
jgi:acyl-CoA thioesterase